MLGKQVPYANTAMYLGMTLNTKLHSKAHKKQKKDELVFKLSDMDWLIRKKFKSSAHKKLMLYRQILEPIWTDLWNPNIVMR